MHAYVRKPSIFPRVVKASIEKLNPRIFDDDFFRMRGGGGGNYILKRRKRKYM